MVVMKGGWMQRTGEIPITGAGIGGLTAAVHLLQMATLSWYLKRRQSGSWILSH